MRERLKVWILENPNQDFKFAKFVDRTRGLSLGELNVSLAFSKGLKKNCLIKFSRLGVSDGAVQINNP